MTTSQSTIDEQELNKFAQHAAFWWDKNGPLKTLHDINTIRLQFITQTVSLSGLKVLDVGCGGGILSEALAKTGATVVGVDAEQTVIDVAKAHAEESGVVVEYQCTAIEEYESPCFDVITCMELLEHVASPALLLQHCHRLLKPGGTLFLSTINRTVKAYFSVVVMAEYVLGLLPKQTHDYQKFIKPSELAAMARSAGFNLEAMKGLAYNPLSRQATLTDNIQINYLCKYSSVLE